MAGQGLRNGRIVGQFDKGPGFVNTVGFGTPRSRARGQVFIATPSPRGFRGRRRHELKELDKGHAPVVALRHLTIIFIFYLTGLTT